MSADIDFLKAVADWENLTNYSRLVELIKRMKQEERNKLQKYVHFAYNHSDAKPYQLFVLIMDSLKQNIALTETDFQRLIGEKYTDEAFNMLVLRLKEKVEDFLVSPFNIEREGSYFHPNIQEAYKIGRRADLLAVLATHGLNEELILTANKYIARAKKRENYNELLKLLYVKLNVLQFRINNHQYLNTIFEEAVFYERCRYAVVRAVYWYNKINAYFNLHGTRNGLTKESETAIKELRKEYKHTQSVTVAYYLLQIEVGHYIEVKNFTKAEKAAKELFKIVNHEAVNRKTTVGTSLYILAYVMLHQTKFNQAIKYALLGKKCFESYTNSFAMGSEIEFYALLYTNQFEKAEMKIASLLTDKYSRFIDNKRSYMYACALFINRKYKECCKILNTINEIDKDREGWNIGIRILTVLVYGELKDFDTAASRMDAFKQHLTANGLLDSERKREITIYRILQDWVKEGMNYEIIFGRRSSDFQLLASNQVGYNWEIRSPEMVIIHEYFRSKAEGTSYAPKISTLPNPSTSISKAKIS